VLIRRPNSVRPWQFVLEPLRGYLTLARRLVEQGRDFSGGWNFGAHDQDMVPVRAVVHRARAARPAVRAEHAAAETGPEEAKTLRLNCAKAATSLLWRPVLNLDDAVRWTVDWHSTVQEAPHLAREVALRQLRLYEGRVMGSTVGS